RLLRHKSTRPHWLLSYTLYSTTSSLTSFHFLFFFNDPATTEIYTLSLHDALPISTMLPLVGLTVTVATGAGATVTSAFALSEPRSEEHTSELQSRFDLVCRLLLEKKKKKKQNSRRQILKKD